MNTNTCIFKGVNNLEKYVSYLLDESKHKNQQIFHNDVISKTDDLLVLSKKWKEQQSSTKGHKPKPLSLVLSFPPNTTKENLVLRSFEILEKWIKKISDMEKLNLSSDEIKLLVKQFPFVGHYKQSNPHIHFLVPRVFPLKTNEKIGLKYINLYKFKYSNPLFQISGWDLKEKIKSEQYRLKQKTKSSELYLKDKLYDEIDKYRNLNDKLDRFIQLIEKDLQRGHTDKAQKKIEKIIGRNK